MVGPDDVRAIALAFAEAEEAGHHGRPSFRVRGKIFATLWTSTQLNVITGEDETAAAVQEFPDMCAELHWGPRVVGIRVDLRHATREAVAPLVAEAWARKAPRAVRRAHLQG